jgi:small subunit ribosomal protein S20
LPQHKSAMKRLRQDKKRRARNRAVKSEVKSVSKRVVTAESGDDVQKLLSQAESTIDRAAKKGVIHWKNAARKKSRLAKRTRTTAS